MLRELNACAALCNICYQACLYEEDVIAMRHCIELNRDCAEICLLAASLFARSAPGTDKILKLCAEICHDCARECKKHDHDHCRKAQHVCNTCAEMCMAYVS